MSALADGRGGCGLSAMYYIINILDYKLKEAGLDLASRSRNFLGQKNPTIKNRFFESNNAKRIMTSLLTRMFEICTSRLVLSDGLERKML